MELFDIRGKSNKGAPKDQAFGDFFTIMKEYKLLP